MPVRPNTAGGFALTVLFAAPWANAFVFDATGNLAFDADAVYTQSFEDGQIAVPEAGVDAGENPLVVVDDPAALEGERVLQVPRFQGVNLALELPEAASAYRVRLWAREELIATVEVGYAEGRVDDFIQLFPTGRMTSDGWYELEGRGFSVEPARATFVALGMFSTSDAQVDGIEVVPDGAASLPKSCSGARDRVSCGPAQVCQWGTCRNMTGRVPALPLPEWRDDLVDYIDGRFNFLYGPFKNRKRDLPSARAEIDGMRSASDAWTFWNHFQVAVRRLHDWHTTGSDVSGFLFENQKPIGLCFIEGEADLSRASLPSHPDYLDVLIYRVGSVNDFGLAPGDRLVAVDGEHPIAWARSLIGIDTDYWTASNHVTHAEFATRLGALVGQFANHIDVLRCDAAAATCATESERISISELEVSPPDTSSGVRCDNRPQSHIPDLPENRPAQGFLHGVVAESTPSEAIYGLQWSSLYVTGGQGDAGDVLKAAVGTWRAQARGVILDHRTGHGGTNLGPPIIWNLVRTTTPLDVFLFRARSEDEGPKTLAEGKAIFDELLALGVVEEAGSANPALDLPVALLIHLDGSASDWLPLGMKGAPNARIFGPFETAGAFSTLFNFGYWFGLGYQIAVGDTIHVSGDTLNGDGVDPDVVVRPLQSDILAGKDTVYDAALAWVRQGLKP